LATTSVRYLSSFLDQKAHDPRLALHGLGNSHHGGLGPVAGAEGVVAVGIAVRRELPGEGGVALLLGLVEAEVLEQEDLAGLHGPHAGRGLLIDAVARWERDGAAQELGEAVGAGLERELGLDTLALGTAQVGHQDGAAPAVQDAADRWGAPRGCDGRR
jgi:hypothetical protein